MRLATTIFLALFLILDGALIYSTQEKIDEGLGTRAVMEELAALPKGQYLKIASLGYTSLVADAIWLKVIQVMGDKVVPPEHARWIYHALDSATDLDPKFAYMYQVGGVFLTVINGEYDLSNRLLKKGFNNNPDDWRLPFYLSTNYFLHLQDYKTAAYYMGKAAELPGRPPFVPLLATRLYAQSGDPRTALELVRRVYENTENKNVKASLEKRMDELVVEINLDELQKAVSEYRNRYNRYPAEVKDLLDARIIGRMPEDPLGGRYSIEPGTGEVTSSSLKRRLKVFEKGPLPPKVEMREKK